MKISKLINAKISVCIRRKPIETKNYYCNYRYYSPVLYRWLTPDSIDYLDPKSINGLNLYCYCGNNPVNYIDPSGHFVISSLIIGLITSTAIGGLISGGLSALNAAILGQDVSAAFWGGFISGAVSSLAVGVGMALGGLPGVIACGLIAFAGGAAGNLTTQVIENDGFSNLNIGTIFFSGVTNAAFTLLTMGSMNLWMSDSFSPALNETTFLKRFVEFMSFDFFVTVGSTYIGTIWSLANTAVMLAQGAIEKEINKNRNNHNTATSAFIY